MSDSECGADVRWPCIHGEPMVLEQRECDSLEPEAHARRVGEGTARVANLESAAERVLVVGLAEQR